MHFYISSLNNLIKGNFTIKMNNEVHSYRTRVANQIHIDFSRTNAGKLSALRKATNLFNALPNQIKNCENLNQFKKLITAHLLNQQKNAHTHN